MNEWVDTGISDWFDLFLASMDVGTYIYAINTNKSIYNFMSLHFFLLRSVSRSNSERKKKEKNRRTSKRIVFIVMLLDVSRCAFVHNFPTWNSTIFFCLFSFSRCPCNTFVCISLEWRKNEKRIQFIIYLSRRLKSNGVSISPHFICICWWFVFAQKQ